MFTTRTVAVVVSIGLAFSLVGCGGGGNSASPSAPPTSAGSPSEFKTATFSAFFVSSPSVEGQSLKAAGQIVRATLFADNSGGLRYTVADFAFRKAITPADSVKLIKQVVSPEFKRVGMTLAFRPLTLNGRPAQAFEGGKTGRYVIGRAVTTDKHVYQVLVQGRTKASVTAQKGFLQRFALTG